MAEDSFVAVTDVREIHKGVIWMKAGCQATTWCSGA